MAGISADIPREVRDILSDLSYIAGLPTGCKYNLTKKTYDQAASWVDSGYRNWLKETKDGAIDYINEKLDHAINVGRRHKMWQQMICKHVVSISDAITNFEHTYVNKYPNIRSDLNVIRLRIDKKAFMVACTTKITEDENPLANPEYYQQSSESDEPKYSYSPPIDIPLIQANRKFKAQKQREKREQREQRGQRKKRQQNKNLERPSRPSNQSGKKLPKKRKQSSFREPSIISSPIDESDHELDHELDHESSSSSPSYFESNSSEEIYHFERSGDQSIESGEESSDQSIGFENPSIGFGEPSKSSEDPQPEDSCESYVGSNNSIESEIPSSVEDVTLTLPQLKRSPVTSDSQDDSL